MCRYCKLNDQSMPKQITETIGIQNSVAAFFFVNRLREKNTLALLKDTISGIKSIE